MMEKAKYILHDTLGVLRSNIINDNPDLEAELLEAMEKYADYKLKNHGDIGDIRGRFYSDDEIAILKEECYQDGIEEGEMNV